LFARLLTVNLRQRRRATPGRFTGLGNPLGTRFNENWFHVRAILPLRELPGRLD